MSAAETTSIVLIGAGSMGRAMLVGWLQTLDASHDFHVVDPGAGEYLAALRDQSTHPTSITHYLSADDLPGDLRVDVIVLATKPQMVPVALRALPKNTATASVVVSVAAGVSISDLQKHLDGEVSTVRVMPNIGAQVGYCVSAGYAPDATKQVKRKLVEMLFVAIGTFCWLEAEDQLHAVTSLSGSGPAYVFAMCEAMIAAGIEQGLNEATSRSLAIATVSAAGRLLEDCPDPRLLREAVTSPNGTTAAGLASLVKEDALGRLINKTLEAAKRQSIALS